MKLSKKRELIVALAFSMSVLVVGADCVKASGDENKVIASVGKNNLTIKDLDMQIQGMPPQLQMALARNPALKERLLERWVQMTLMSLEAEKEGLDKKTDVQKRIKDMKNALLAQEYMNIHVKNNTEVTDEDLKKYYNENKDKFKNPESVKARHILVKVAAGADDAAWKAALKKINDVKKKLKKGEDFAKLAKEYSDDPGSKQKGGDLGYFTKGRMVPEFEKAAFSMKKGEISDPVKTNFGYHLIEVTDKKAASQKPFEEAKSGIKRTLTQEKQQKVMDDLMAKLKKKYKVTEHPELLKSALPNDDIHKNLKKK